jgi:hypothetical protein
MFEFVAGQAERNQILQESIIHQGLWNSTHAIMMQEQPMQFFKLIESIRQRFQLVELD